MIRCADDHGTGFRTKRARRCGFAGRVVALAFLVWLPPPAAAHAASSKSATHPNDLLSPGAIELGVAGAAARVEGLTRGSAALRCGGFLAAGRGLAGMEGEVDYQHVSGLDALGLEANLSWQFPMSGGTAYPYAALAGGLRQEWLGSFREVRYPVGGTLGLRTMLGRRAATRVEARFRRVLGDPVANFNEYELRLGLSVFFAVRQMFSL